jgi:protein-disulfide isomerase
MKKQSIWQFIILSIVLVVGAAACGPVATEGPSLVGVEEPADTAVSDAGNDTAVAPESEANTDDLEYDANGIEVGFTEDGRPYRGDRNAPVVLEEYSDFQCPYCARYVSETLPSLMENQIADGEVMTVFYDFPLTSIHPQAAAASHAARCAGEQGAVAYWAMHDQIFANSSEWSNNNADDVFNEYAEALDLDTAAFKECQSSAKYEQAIQDDINLARGRGISSTPSFFVNDQPLIGAQPLASFNAAITAVNNGEQIAGNDAEPAPAALPTPATIPTDNIAGAMGDPNAPVTIVEYTDFQCPFCQRHSQETLPQLVTDMIESGRIYYIMKDFPLDQLHPDARTAAAAARCAGDQDAFWEMHDAIFDNQANWAEQDAATVLAGIAAELSLDVDAYNDCMDSGKYDDAVQANLEEGMSLGVTGTPAFFIEGFPITGAQPYELFDYAIRLAESGELAAAYEPREEPTAVPQPTGPVDVPIGDAYGLGDPNAPVTIIEYTDFQCPYCSRHFQQTFSQIKANFVDTGLVYYVFKDFPLTTIHPQAQAAAEAARCAGEQNAYVEMHDVLFTAQSDWSGQANAADLFVSYAEQLGLDTSSFSDCLQTHKYETAVQADLQEGVSFGVRGTPAFFINGNFVSGAQPYANFEQAINQMLDQ